MAGRSSAFERIIIALAGVLGAAGVAAAAGASHGSDVRLLSAISTIALAHAPALLALGLAQRPGLFRLAGGLLAVGTVVFVADLAARQYLATAPLPLAAPVGGLGMILGWVVLAVAGLLTRR